MPLSVAMVLSDGLTHIDLAGPYDRDRSTGAGVTSGLESGLAVAAARFWASAAHHIPLAILVHRMTHTP